MYQSRSNQSKKRKLVTVMGVVLGFSLWLTGCSNISLGAPISPENINLRGEAKNVNIKNNEMSNDGIKVDHLKNDETGELRFYDNVSEGFPFGQGFYRVTNNKEGMNTSRISYIDFNSNMEIPLCNQPQCNHDTQLCEALFYGEQYMSTQIVPMGGKIYVLTAKNPVYEALDSGSMNGFTMAESVAYSTALYEMNLDGTGRTELLEIDSSYQITNTMVSGNGKIIVTGIKQIPENVVVKSVILQIDVASKTLTELEDDGTICGVWGNRVVISRSGYGDLTGMSDGEAMAAIKNSTNTIISYDVETKAITEHGTVPPNEMPDNFVYDNQFFYTSGRKGIYKINLDTNEKGTVTEQLSDGFFIVSKADGKIVCSFNDGAEINAETTYCTSVDCLTGTVSDFTLFTRQSVSKHGVSILGNGEGKYLVKSDIIEKSEYIEWAGVTQINMIGEGYSLIKKDNYWNNIGDFEPISMLD